MEAVVLIFLVIVFAVIFYAYTSVANYISRNVFNHKVTYKIVGKNEKYGDFEAEKEAYLPINPFPGLMVGLHFNLPNGNEMNKLAEVTEIYWKEKTKIVKVMLGHITCDIETLKANNWEVFAVVNMVYSRI